MTIAGETWCCQTVGNRVCVLSFIDGGWVSAITPIIADGSRSQRHVVIPKSTKVTQKSNKVTQINTINQVCLFL